MIGAGREENALSVARSLVEAFNAEHGSKLDCDECDLKIKQIYEELSTVISQLSTADKPFTHDFEVISHALPSDMRTWFIARQYLSQTVDKGLFALSTSTQSITSPYTIENQNWSEVEIVQRAAGGQRGAWFFSHAVHGCVVVKNQEGSEYQVMGSAFLRLMGVNAPDVKRVDSNSSEGKTLAEKGADYGLTSFVSSHFLVMDRVWGSDYGSLTSDADDIELVVNNLENLGELAIYDLVLGNFDRFQLDSTVFNAGNIMFEKGVLRPIDTDCIPVHDREALTRLILQKIAERRGGYEQKTISKLAEHLGPGIDPSRLSAVKIREGMERAIGKIEALVADLSEKKRLFLDSCQQRGLELTEFPKQLEGLLKHLIECHTKTA